MRGLYFDGNQLSFRKDLPQPVLREGEALIAVQAAGICRTDQEILAGYMHFHGIPGHEFIGTVTAASEPQLVGKRVVGEINCPCGGCELCRLGLQPHCRDRTVLGVAQRDGAFAEYLALPTANLHAIPDSLTPFSAVFVEPLAAAFRVVEQLPIGPGSSVAVVGDGKLGQLVARVMRLTGCDLLAIGHHPAKLKLLDRLGIRTALESELAARDFDFVVECSGNPTGLDVALRIVRPQGTIVAKSTYHGDKQLNISALVADEISIVGSRCGPFKPAIRALTRGLVDVADLMDRSFSLEEGLAAFEYAARRDALKVIIDMQISPAAGLHGPGEPVIELP